MSDTDTELIALLAKLRKLQETLDSMEAQQLATREEFAKTQARADELRRRAKEKGQ